MVLLHSEQVFPPAPNWYNAHVAVWLAEIPTVSIAQLDDSQQQDRYPPCMVYAARSLLVFLNTETWSVWTFLKGKEGVRINATAGLVDESRGHYWLGTGGADGKVQVWDYPQRRVVGTHGHHGSEVTALAITSRSALLVSGDKAGRVVVYDPVTQHHCTASFHKSTVYVIRTVCDATWDYDLVAIGHQNGGITIAKVSKDSAGKSQVTCSYRLEDHTDEIHDLLWILPASNGEGVGSGRRLVSSSRDKTLRLWDVSEEQVLQQIKLPRAKQFYTDHQKGRVWIALAPYLSSSPHTILVTSYMGEILTWDFLHNQFSTKKRFAQGPTRTVFGLLVNQDRSELYSVSMDRSLIKFNINTGKVLCKAGSLGGHVYSVRVPAQEPTRLTIACGDGSIRLWDCSSPGNSLDSVQLWRGIKGKVTSVAHHPVSDHLIAYGNDRGLVCLFDISKDSSLTFKTYHKGTVYSLVWCPRDPLLAAKLPDHYSKRLRIADDSPTEQGYWLIGCGADGTLRLFDPDRLKEPSFDLCEALYKSSSTLQELHRTKSSLACEVAIDHPTQPTLLAVGNTDGSVELYRWPNLDLVTVYHCHRGWISRIQFKPLPLGSHSSPTLAIAASDGTVTIHDLSVISTEATDVSQDAAIVPRTTPLLSFRGHSREVSDLCWHPDPASPWMATSSFDGSAIVWDSTTGKILGRFDDHYGRCLCISWDLLDSDILITGSDDQTVRRWRLSANPAVEKPPKSPQGSKSPGSGVPMDTEKQQGATRTTGTEQPRTVETKGTGAIPALSHPPPSGSTAPTPPAKKRRKNKQTNLFPELTQRMLATSREVQHKLCWKLAEQAIARRNHSKDNSTMNTNLGPTRDILAGPSEDSTETTHPSLADLLFGEVDDVYSLVSQEASCHYTRASTASIPLSSMLDVWHGQILTALLKALSQETTADIPGAFQLLFLAVSPAAGRDVWRQGMLTMASQYNTLGETNLAALFYLAIDQPQKAVAVYQQAEKFREALILARLRLGHDTDLIRSLWAAWADQLLLKDYCEQAAQCFLYLGDMSSALGALSRRHDLVSLKLTTDIAVLAEDSSVPQRLLRYAEETLCRGKTNLTWEHLCQYSVVYHTHWVKQAKLRHAQASTPVPDQSYFMWFFNLWLTAVEGLIHEYQSNPQSPEDAEGNLLSHRLQQIESWTTTVVSTGTSSDPKLIPQTLYTLTYQVLEELRDSVLRRLISRVHFLSAMEVTEFQLRDVLAWAEQIKYQYLTPQAPAERLAAYYITRALLCLACNLSRVDMLMNIVPICSVPSDLAEVGWWCDLWPSDEMNRSSGDLEDASMKSALDELVALQQTPPSTEVMKAGLRCWLPWWMTLLSRAIRQLPLCRNELYTPPLDETEDSRVAVENSSIFTVLRRHWQLLLDQYHSQLVRTPNQLSQDVISSEEVNSASTMNSTNNTLTTFDSLFVTLGCLVRDAAEESV
ncbi:hypothetical protein IWQ62_001552 [Dispira parvispora]|uniref:Gem-associated protein 5 TPR domain-containing protein n=1 Tax=Dispira parvispora TaxID=1520584 RepID=A0A9W8AUS2_9FUNG|nr:hypothetical protein IWQ62_001552 [Dispira parvispora]